MMAYYGGRGRNKCPTSVSKWYYGSDSGNGYLQKSDLDINLKCGTDWSDWSECDQSACGDSFIYRTRIDENGKQCTIAWHVDDCIATHVDQKTLDHLGKKMIYHFGDMKIHAGNEHDFLGMNTRLKRQLNVHT